MGILLVDKPKDITSFDVIHQLRKITGIKKIGHAGTLDPNASGLLIVAIEREFTKKLGELSKFTQKEYIAEITLGEERDTHDPEGVVIATSDKQPNITDINKALEKFKGEIDQIPPKHSAIKINGKKAYDLARADRDFELEPRKVSIYELNLLDYKYPVLNLQIKCSAGTYIRSIARDLGRDLGTYGYLSNLRRTKIGDYSIDNAHELSSINSENWQSLQL